MANEVGGNLKGVLASLANVVGSLFRQFPFFFVVLMVGAFKVLLLFTHSKNKMEFGLCLLVSFVSIIIYAQTKKYAETMLSFMVSILTIFTINWDGYNSKIFIAFYIGINVLVFFLSTIMLASNKETDITHAASYISRGNFKEVYGQLDAICNKPTKFQQISVLDKAQAIRYLAYASVKMDQMFAAIEYIEMIKVVYGIPLNEALNFYRDIFFVGKRSTNYFDTSHFLDKVVSIGLPLTPSEFMEIFNKTKKMIISGRMDVDSYLAKVAELAYSGHSNDEIVAILNE